MSAPPGRQIITLRCFLPRITIIVPAESLIERAFEAVERLAVSRARAGPGLAN